MSPYGVIVVLWIMDYELITLLGPERLILRVFLFRTWAKHMELWTYGVQCTYGSIYYGMNNNCTEHGWLEQCCE